MNVLQEADKLVNGDRQDDYGHPWHDFSRTAQMWGAILGCEVTPEQVGLCMMAVKISRQCNKPKADNLIDSAGYAQCVQMCVERRNLLLKPDLVSAPNPTDSPGN